MGSLENTFSLQVVEALRMVTREMPRASDRSSTMTRPLYFKFWKDLGLTVRDASGNLLQVDDERLAPIFDRCGELGVPVMVHTDNPDASVVFHEVTCNRT
jgi:predicted TIM-barrel fold metal-dependent hydrolase